MNFQETLFPGYTIGEDAYQNISAVCALSLIHISEPTRH